VTGETEGEGSRDWWGPMSEKGGREEKGETEREKGEQRLVGTNE
jgi:hypothetical protein